MRPAGGPLGIFWWMMPLPAVFPCAAPRAMAPPVPVLSAWSAVPARTELLMSSPRSWGAVERLQELGRRCGALCGLLAQNALQMSVFEKNGLHQDCSRCFVARFHVLCSF